MFFPKQGDEKMFILGVNGIEETKHDRSAISEKLDIGIAVVGITIGMVMWPRFSTTT